MKRKILVTYASRGKSTMEIAKAICEALKQQCGEVELRFILDVNDITPYDAIVVGSSVRSMQWLPEAIQFIKTHQQQLREKSVAYFVVSMTMHEDTPENRTKVTAILDQVRSWVEPVDIGLFAGTMQQKKLNFFSRLMVKFLGVPDGDFRDFTAIRRWATQLANKLSILK